MFKRFFVPVLAAALLLLAAAPLATAQVVDKLAESNRKKIEAMLAAEVADKKPDSLEKQEALIKAVQPALVVVEYTLQYDKGEAPRGSDHAGRQNGNLADIIREERPLEVPGILLDDTHVASDDLHFQPRFIKSIAIRKLTAAPAAAPATPAKISAYAKARSGVILELSAPLKNAAPLKFDPALPGPYSVVSYEQNNGQWTVNVNPFSPVLALTGARKSTQGASGVVVDKNGAPVAVAVDDELPADNSWKGSPLQWPAYSAEQMAKLLDTLDQQAEKNIVRVTLNFRSPKATDRAAASIRGGGGRGDNDPNATVQHVLGVILDPQSILILAELKPAITTRLERIRVFTDPPVDAKFKASLADYGALLAQPEKPFATPATLSAKSITDLRGIALPVDEIIVQGEKRVSYVQHSRITGLTLGWQKNLYPDVIGANHGTIVFDPDGALLALPVTRREKAAVEERYSYGNSNPLMTSFAQLAAALADLKKNADPANIPLSEEEENRIAWLGVELQPLNQELARANNVSDLTSDGETGALVTYVYPDSPAAKAGVDIGWVLLRIEAPGQPKPIDVRVELEPFYTKQFPWDKLEQVSEQYFDQIPSPWPPVESTFTRTITDLGFGKTYTAEFFSDGKSVKKAFTVDQSPFHYLNAPKFKDAALGLTVRDLSYEVRRYLQKKPGEPGVVIAKIELGSKASVSGLKPFELITAVNDQEVKNVHDFEKFTKGQDEVRLSIKRMTKGRIVKIKLSAAEGPPATAPTTQPNAH